MVINCTDSQYLLSQRGENPMWLGMHQVQRVCPVGIVRGVMSVALHLNQGETNVILIRVKPRQLDIVATE